MQNVRCIDHPGRGSCIGVGMLATRVILFGVALAQLTDALTFTIRVSRFGIGVLGFAANSASILLLS